MKYGYKEYERVMFFKTIGMSIKNIAKAVGISQSTVRAILKNPEKYRTREI